MRCLLHNTRCILYAGSRSHIASWLHQTSNYMIKHDCTHSKSAIPHRFWAVYCSKDQVHVNLNTLRCSSNTVAYSRAATKSAATSALMAARVRWKCADSLRESNSELLLIGRLSRCVTRTDNFHHFRSQRLCVLSSRKGAPAAACQQDFGQAKQCGTSEWGAACHVKISSILTAGCRSESICMGSNLTTVAMCSPTGLPEKCCAKVRIVIRRGAADASARHPSSTLVLMTSSTPWWSGANAMPPPSMKATVVVKMPCVPN